MIKDYYFILGISFSATQDEIKKAYRINAIKYHPDKNFGDPVFAQKFIDIKEAYDTLSDPNKKSAFDKEYETAFGKQSFSSSADFHSDKQEAPNINSNFKTKNENERKAKAKEEEEFRYNPYKHFYSHLDREQQETPPFPPQKSPLGTDWQKTAIFFNLPGNIGKIISGFTNFSNEVRPKGFALVSKVIKSDLLGIIILSGIVTGICYIFIKDPQILLIIFSGLLFLLFLRVLYIGSGSGVKTYTNYYIGINGFAMFKRNNKTADLLYSLEVNFNEVTDLVVRIEVRKRNFNYVNTAYQYLWFDVKKYKVIHEASLVRDDKQNEVLSVLTEHEYWMNKEAEKYWTVYLLDNMENELQKKGYLSFNLFIWEKGIFFPYIKVGIGFITFIEAKEEFTYKFNDIKRIYSKGTELFLEHKNFEKKFFFFKSGNKNSVNLANLSNRQFFIKAIELLLGYNIY